MLIASMMNDAFRALSTDAGGMRIMTGATWTRLTRSRATSSGTILICRRDFLEILPNTDLIRTVDAETVEDSHNPAITSSHASVTGR